MCPCNFSRLFLKNATSIDKQLFLWIKAQTRTTQGIIDKNKPYACAFVDMLSFS